MSNSSRSAPRLCPFCDGAPDGPAFPYRTRFAGEEFTYVGCRRCATIYVDPVPSAATFDQMYATSSYHDVHYDGDGQGEYALRAELLVRHLPKGARILDYGCGAGHLLNALAARGFEPSGAEFSAEAARNAAERTGHPVYDLSDPDWANGQSWDCIHFGDVIEHLADPRDALSKAVALLSPGGMLSAEGPLEANRSLVHSVARLFGWLKKTVKPDAVPSFPPYHLVMVTAPTQRLFFGQLGADLHELHWEITETGWPYRHNGALRNAIALAAIGASYIMPGCGDRFHALYRKGG